MNPALCSGTAESVRGTWRLCHSWTFQQAVLAEGWQAEAGSVGESGCE